MAFNRDKADAPYRKRNNFPGTCATHQRALTVAIKRARHVALMPYAER